MAAIGFALALAPEQWWDPLSGPERDRLAHWLLSALPRATSDNNWLFFPVLIALGLDRVGVRYDRSLITTRLDRLETFWLGDGWYADGPTERRDYYVPWSMHFYGLLYDTLTDGDRFKDRAARFAGDFRHWFADDGAAVPYGRSLTYRWAQAAFWGALPFAGVDVLPWGQIKGYLLRHLRWWHGRPVTGPDGVLSIGYGYPQPALAEQYNAFGSPTGRSRRICRSRCPPSTRSGPRGRRRHPHCPPSVPSRTRARSSCGHPVTSPCSPDASTTHGCAMVPRSTPSSRTRPVSASAFPTARSDSNRAPTTRCWR